MSHSTPPSDCTARAARHSPARRHATAAAATQRPWRRQPQCPMRPQTQRSSSMCWPRPSS
eukprot:3579588-Rhodomonas_salina.2